MAVRDAAPMLPAILFSPMSTVLAGTVEWSAAVAAAPLGGVSGVGMLSESQPLPSASAMVPTMSRAEEIRAKREGQKARVAAFAGQKRAEQAAAAARQQAEVEMRAAADQQMRAAAELRAKAAAEAQAKAARQAVLERQAAEAAEAKARELQAKYESAAVKKGEIAKKAAAKREKALSAPALSAVRTLLPSAISCTCFR